MLLEQKNVGVPYLTMNTASLVALEVDVNKGATNNVPQRVKSKLHMAAAARALQDLAATAPKNSPSEHCFVRTGNCRYTTTSDTSYLARS